jgi:hypothetical protein
MWAVGQIRRIAVTNRRAFIQAATLAALVPALPAVAASRRLQLYKVLYDTRLPGAAEFAGEMRRSGQSLAAFSGNVTPVWLSDLQDHCQRSSMAIAGMTDHRTWFVLDLMARGGSLRTVYYDCVPLGGQPDLRRVPDDLAVQHGSMASVHLSAWAQRMAAVVATYPAEPSALYPAPAPLGPPYCSAGEIGALACWIIAQPRRSLAV